MVSENLQIYICSLKFNLTVIFLFPLHVNTDVHLNFLVSDLWVLSLWSWKTWLCCRRCCSRSGCSIWGPCWRGLVQFGRRSKLLEPRTNLENGMVSLKIVTELSFGFTRESVFTFKSMYRHTGTALVWLRRISLFQSQATRVHVKV